MIRKRKMPLCAQAREMVICLLRYFEKEAQHGNTLLPVTQVQQRLIDAFGITRKTLIKINKDRCETSGSGIEVNELPTPIHAKRKCTLTDISSLDIDAIRNHITAYHERGEYLTLNMLVTSLEEANLYRGSAVSLNTVLCKAGIEYKNPCTVKNSTKPESTTTTIDIVKDNDKSVHSFKLSPAIDKDQNSEDYQHNKSKSLELGTSTQHNNRQDSTDIYPQCFVEIKTEPILPDDDNHKDDINIPQIEVIKVEPLTYEEYDEAEKNMLPITLSNN